MDSQADMTLYLSTYKKHIYFGPKPALYTSERPQIKMVILYVSFEFTYHIYYLRRFSESRSSSGSTPSVRNTLGIPSLCNL